MYICGSLCFVVQKLPKPFNLLCCDFRYMGRAVYLCVHSNEAGELRSNYGDIRGHLDEKTMGKKLHGVCSLLAVLDKTPGEENTHQLKAVDTIGNYSK